MGASRATARLPVSTGAGHASPSAIFSAIQCRVEGVGVGRAGRKRKQGERYPSGDIKQQAEGIPGALWQRIRTHAVKFGLDPRIDSEISRLSMLRELTDAQAVTAFRIGDIFHRYYRARGLRFIPQSPDYEIGNIGSADLAEERMSEDRLGEHEDEIRRAHAAWRRLCDILHVFEGSLRDAVFRLCVRNKAVVAPVRLQDVRQILDVIGLRLQDDRRFVRPVLPKLGYALRGTTAYTQQVASAVQPRTDAQLLALEDVIRRLRADVEDEEVVELKQTWLALVDRYRFRAAKR